jgi:hypothetical protein
MYREEMCVTDAIEPLLVLALMMSEGQLGTAVGVRAGQVRVSILSAHPLDFFHDLEKRPLGLWRTEEGPDDLPPRTRQVSKLCPFPLLFFFFFFFSSSSSSSSSFSSPSPPLPPSSLLLLFILMLFLFLPPPHSSSDLSSIGLTFLPLTVTSLSLSTTIQSLSAHPLTLFQSLNVAHLNLLF